MTCSAIDTTFLYSGGTPGADTSDYTLLDTTTAFPSKHGLARHGIRYISVLLNNAAACTLLVKFSNNRGTSWRTSSSTSVSAVTATAQNEFLIFVGGYPDLKIYITNGGSAQTGFDPVITGLQGAI